jgi:SIR2-like domain
MSILAGDPLTQLSFSVYENEGAFALLLGSGLSRAAEIPTGWEITLDLIRRVAEAQGVEPQPDWAQWYRDTTGAEPNYSALLEELASSPDERRSILHSYIEPTDEDREEGRKIPTAAHRAIAELVRAGYIRVIITTNFDRVIENALREVGVEPTIVASVDALQGAEPITHSTCYILKLHGDYKDARILNTDQELSGYPPEYDRLLDRIFDEFGLIICGWSGEWDHALRAAVLRMPNRRYPVYWAARGQLAAGAQELVDHRSARVIAISDADGFFSALSQRVHTLEQSHRQNPLSVELLVQRTKRYLAKPEYRIQLDELFTEEAERLTAQLDASEFAPHGSWSPEEFRARITRYEAATEPLARMAGALGRWGDGSELPIVLDLLRAILAHADKIGSGMNVWLNIRSYPAVLLFTAYGLGLTRAGRWPVLHELFSAPLARQYDDPHRVVEALFLWAWKGGENSHWQRLEGLDRHHTALSHHLLAVFSRWATSFVGVTPDFELLFERFEMLASLAYLEATDTAAI